MKDYNKENTDDPSVYLNEVTINSGFIPYYKFAADFSTDKDKEA